MKGTGTLANPQIIAHLEKSLNYTLFDVKWVPCSARFVVVGSHPKGTGAIQVFEMSQKELKVTKSYEKKESLKCCTFAASSLQERHLATGSFSGKLETWDLERGEMPVYSVKAHTEIINCIDGCGGLGIGIGAPEIVTGSRDGAVKVWDVRQNDDPVALMQPKEGEARRDCWAVAFGNAYTESERVIAAGYDNGDIKLFDLRNMQVRWEHNIKNGVCGLQFDRKDILMNKLVATSLESKFHTFDMRTQHLKNGFPSVTEKAHKSTVWGVRHLPQNRDIFVTLGGNGSIALWKYNYPKERTKQDADGVEMGVAGTLDQVNNVVLGTQPIAALDWSPDKEGLCVCSGFDQTVRICIVTKLKSL